MNEIPSRAYAHLVETAPALALVRPARKAHALAATGREMPVSSLGETVDGVRLFNEGDDPRTLEPRLSDLLETDIALEYVSVQLGSALVVVDAGLRGDEESDAGLAGSVLAALIASALGRGGHPVGLGDTGNEEIRMLNRSRGKPVRATRATKADLRRWLRARGADGLFFSHLILVTDADWTREEAAALPGAAVALSGDATL